MFVCVWVCSLTAAQSNLTLTAILNPLRDLKGLIFCTLNMLTVPSAYTVSMATMYLHWLWVDLSATLAGARARAHAHRYLHSSAINGLSHAFNIFTKILNAWHHGIMLVDLHCTISLRHTVNTRRRTLKWQCCALLCFLHFICRGQNWALFSIKPNDSFKNSCFVTTHTMNIGPPISTKSPSLGFKPYWPPLPPTKSSESICCYELRWWRKAKRRRSRESSWVKHHRKTFFFFRMWGSILLVEAAFCCFWSFTFLLWPPQTAPFSVWYPHTSSKKGIKGELYILGGRVEHCFKLQLLQFSASLQCHHPQLI